MRIVQFEIPSLGRRLGVVRNNTVVDITSGHPDLTRVADVFRRARRQDAAIELVFGELLEHRSLETHDYQQLLPFLHPPVDHADPYRVLITGTGLTHTGSMQSRDQMHSDSTDSSAGPETPSAEMFRMGLEGGKPGPGRRGVAPEWFYKGNGFNLRGPRDALGLPAFALDGGEEPEIVGMYMIDDDGTPFRLGFTLGNEWSDHATEQINYLYLAPSKLRVCAVGPELVTDCAFEEIHLRCTVRRAQEIVYDSGPLVSGEQHMCHSLANCEDHHFKYPQHRQPGDVHLHFFGTSRLSHSSRDWKFADGDLITIESPEFGAPLVNRVVAGDDSLAKPVVVRPA